MAPAGDNEEYRAILTPREREILSEESEVSDSYYYRVVSRVREKIGQLEIDRDILENHHDGLANELREAVCNGEDNQ